ncbi:CHAT domain-containing protein [Nocardiopsis sp. NPDC049922]|uniref:CHAT domain-containing protein n=1 Tax=Nocardiopsis sp. NPDC049922 TaxID=3155157 RepID=UPI0033F69CF2
MTPPVPPSGRLLLARVRRGVRLARSGLFETTADLLDDTHRRLRGHPVAEVAPVVPGVLVNLGLAQTMCGRFDQAGDHLAEAHALTREHGLPLLGMIARQNQGCLALYRGDTVTAIDTFLSLLPELPPERSEALHVDLAEALLSEGLVEEAAAALDEGPCTESGSATATALLVEAKLRFLEGDRRRAAELTRRVRGTFGRGSLWFRLATRLERVALAPGPPGRAVADAGPVSRARDRLRIRLPGAAAHPGCPASRRALDVLAGGAAHAAVPAPGRWLGAAAHDPHVVRAGLESALRAGTAATALEWAELTRTWAVPRVPGPREPDTPTLNALAGHYRAALALGRGPSTARHARLWEAARWRACRAASAAEPTASSGPAPVTGKLLARLGADRAFIHLTWAGGDAVALVAVAGRVHARLLGPVARAVRALARFTHTLPEPACRSRAAAVRAAAAEVSRVLLAPLLPLVGDRPLVLAADPRLGDPPWGMLPALCGRAVNLVPTARFWVERADRWWPGRTDSPRPATGRVLLVAAPAPEGARREVAALSRVYPRARVLSGDGARWSEVVEGFADSDVVHLAGHGHVPDRVPLLASIDLVDGPLLARDLGGLTAAPGLVALSTCWNGRGFGGVTGTPSGFVGALHARGVRTVVASPVPVRDAEAEGAMVRFHRAVAEGVPVSEAVALHLGRAGFCCFGA